MERNVAAGVGWVTALGPPMLHRCGMRRLLLLVLVLCSACRDDDTVDVGLAAVADTLVWGEDRAGTDTLEGPIDRRFLETVLDHYQGIEHLAERVRQTSGVSAVRRDAWRFDHREAGERERAAELLRNLYGERYLPLVPEEFRAAAADIAVRSAEEQPRALLEYVQRHQQEDVTRIDSVLPLLQHPHVRELARDIRRDQQRDLRVLARRLARD
jgi:uncharacterized protein (DUF305 family)